MDWSPCGPDRLAYLTPRGICSPLFAQLIMSALTFYWMISMSDMDSKGEDMDRKRSTLIDSHQTSSLMSLMVVYRSQGHGEYHTSPDSTSPAKCCILPYRLQCNCCSLLKHYWPVDLSSSTPRPDSLKIVGVTEHLWDFSFVVIGRQCSSSYKKCPQLYDDVFRYL